MSTCKLVTTRQHYIDDACIRYDNKPLIRPSDISAIDERLEVIGVLNPTFLNLNGRRLLIVRVDEKPRGTNKIYGNNRTLVAYINLRKKQIDVLNLKLPERYNPNREPILPESVRFDPERPDLLLSYISYLRIIEFEDKDQIKVNNESLLFPDSELNQYGCEDPRATIIDGQAFLTYVAVSKFGATTWLAKLTEQATIHDKFMILGPDHKHAVLFPTKIRDKYYMLTRPLSRTYINSNGAWLFQSPDMVHWGNPRPFLLPRPGMWDSERVGPSTSPVMINDDWLLFYYGVDKEDSYHIGAVLIDAQPPFKVIGRTNSPLLSPSMNWEKQGRRADTVFACGLEYFNLNNNIRLYYGAGDTCIGAADLNVAKLLSYIS